MVFSESSPTREINCPRWNQFRKYLCLGVVSFAVLLFPLLSVAQEAAPANTENVEQPDPNLRSPRQVMRTFLTAMKEMVEGKESASEVAVSCLDLSGLPQVIRPIRGQELAVKLLGIINRTRYVKFGELPDANDGPPYVFLDHALGQVRIEKGSGSNWRFPKSTVEIIPDLYRALEKKKLAEGVVNAEELVPISMRVRKYVPEILKGTTFLLEDWQWVALIGTIFGAYLLKLLFGLFLGAVANRIMSRTAFLRTSDSIGACANPAAYFVTAVVLQIIINLLDLPVTAYTYFSVVLSTIRTLALIYVLYILIDILAEILLIKASQTSTRADDVLIPLFQRIGKVAVLVVGVVLIADVFEFNVAGLVAGLGLGGLAFALAAKDTVENLFGSITVLLDSPFKVGDYISIAGIEGTVEHIGLRSTRIRTPMNSLVTMPNSQLISSSVDNLGARQYRHTRVMLGVTYGTPVAKIEEFCEGIRELIRNHPHTRKDYFHVHFNEFGSSSLDVMLNVYFSVHDYSADLEARESLLLDVMRLAESLGIEFAFPTRTIHIESEPQSRSA